MSFASWLKTIKAHANRTPIGRRTFLPRLESLEDRLAPAAVLTVNSILDTNVRDASLTFREALLVNNRTLAVATLSAAEQAQVTGTPSAADADTIKFNIGAGGVQTIALTSALPLITDSVTIDGATQPGFAGSPIIELNGAGAGSANGLFIIAGNSTVRGLAINRFIGNGIEIQGNGNNRIEGCFVGTDVTGTLDRGNTGIGVNISSTNDNVIGGTATGAGNVISGNDSAGIKVIFSMRNQILGNRVGTNAAGTAVVPNGGDGIVFNSASNNTVGGTTAAARNIVSGNVIGIYLLSSGQNNVVIGNYVGTDVTGTVDLGNRSYGVALETLGTNGTRVGGATPAERNLISGNGLEGVFVNSHGNSVLGNYIGTDVTGSAPLGNSGTGVRHNFGFNTLVIGNVISANAGDGVFLSGQYTGTRVQGNRIGTNAAGAADLGNRAWGVRVASAAPTDTDLRIGGTGVGEGNVIAYNDRAGVAVQHQDARGVAILGNSIFANDRIPVGSGLGIDLFVEGVTPNDVGDADAQANLQQNFPVLTAATNLGGSTTITGTLNSTASTTFRIEFFANVAADPTGFGEGQTYLGFTEVTTDAGGNVAFTTTVTGAAAGQFASATATRLVDHDVNPATPLVPRETSEFSQVRIIVQANQAPVANADAYSIDEDGTLTQPGPGVLGNDTDADGNPLTAILVTGTSHGSLTLNANGSFAYTPAADYFGPDGFTYKANDGTADSNVATDSITVTPVNDAPVAANGSLSTAEDTGATGTLVATDIDSAAWTYSVVDASNAHGTVTITDASTGAYSYSPDADYNGPASFTFKANDGALDSNVATVSLTVTPVNDAPVAQDQDITTNEDTATSGTPGASDVDSDSLTFSIVTGASHGTVTITNDATGAFTYTSAPNYDGVDSFTFKANDGTVDSNVALVSITITPVNDAPMASNGSLSTAEDMGATGALVATDIDSATLTYNLVDASTAHGTVTITNASTGAYSYNPDANYNGPASFTFKANDGALDSNVATVSITVTPVNDAPTASNGILITAEDTGATGTLVATDIDSAAWTYSVVDASNAHGTVTITDASTGAYSYNPDADYHGPASFTFKANDGALDSNIATVSITVTPVNDAPVAPDDSYSTAEDTSLSVSSSAGVLANDSDGDGDPRHAVVVSGPSHGSLTLNDDGSFSYLPEANYNGPDTFTYKANDGAADSNVATVSITVSPVNDPPVITSDGGGETAALSVPENTTAVATVTAYDADSATLTFTISGGADAGKFTIDAGTGELRFITAPDFEAPTDANGDNVYEVQVQVSDGALTDTQAITVTVTDVADNQSPVYIGQGCCDPTALVIKGTEGNDKIRVIPQGDGGAGAVKVLLNGAQYFFAAGSFTSIVILGKGGDDDIALAGTIDKPACIFGGAGNDRLKGGAAADILLGGDGCDLLLGDAGRDLLIGGFGADHLVGNSDDDILIAGTTDFDANDAALCAIMDEWTRCDASYCLRVSHLEHGGGRNAEILLSDATVHDDGAQDRLTGSAGRDWFFANRDCGVRDTVTDSHCDEVFEDID